MPITIDTSSDNIEQQVQSNANIVALNKQVDAKYFSKNMTGNGKRKDGLFTTDADSITDFLKNSSRLVSDITSPRITQHELMDAHLRGMFGAVFKKDSKPKEDRYQLFERNLTTMIPPTSLINIFDDQINGTALSFPKDTAMFGFNALEKTWVKLSDGTIDGKKATIYAQPIIESIDLYAKEEAHQSKSGAVSKKSKTAGVASIYIAVATVMNDMQDGGTMVIVNTGNHLGKNGYNARQDGRMTDVFVKENQGVVSLFELGEMSPSEYDYHDLHANIVKHTNTISNSNLSITIPDVHSLSLLIGDLSMSEILKAQATVITHQAEEALLTFASTLSKRYAEIKRKTIDPSGNGRTTGYTGRAKKIIEKALVSFVQHIDILNDLEDDLITTELLADVYHAMREHMGDQKEMNKMARHSLRLLLAQRLHELDALSKNDGLYKFDPQDKQIEQAMSANPNYSVQQKRIVTTTDPLVIGQAGAGSGKSHTLIGRINYLKDQGEDLKKILVLSFTNVAAINITNRFPNVRSETLANMFHTIYNATYPHQQLSQPSTVANSIRLLNPKSNYFKNLGVNEDVLEAFMDQFATRLEQFDQTGFKRVNLQQELKHLSNLIENHLDLTVYVLNAIEQTTLELEPIIIHHMLLGDSGRLNIPEVYQNLNYIITDESQDISTFEYILLLELTIHYRSQLLIIGDGSQTLYEFRNSDPRYMNALESSNVFVSHKLETNYRSKEEILMFANQFLQVIDANKYAKIQLKSSNFSVPTIDSFKETITIANNELTGTRSTDYKDSVKSFIEQDVEFEKWFIDRVKKGEQVAIMGWTRQEVIAAGEAIETILNKHGQGHVPITNIMSENERPMTLLSRFARAKNETLRSLDPVSPQYAKELERQVEMFITKAHPRASSAQVNFFEGFIKRNISTVLTSHEWAAWMADYKKGTANKYQVGSFLIQQLLRLETRKNAMDQFLRKRKDVPNYDECPIILSTIHGTKGLEFDHTVVLFNEAKRGSTSQESMRMMFVALSRAKQSEFIVNSHTQSVSARSVGSSHASMFQTPINSAYLRTLDAVAELNKKNQNAATS